MKISGFLRETFLDYPGKLACEIFTSGCNFRCPACHARKTIYNNKSIPQHKIFDYIKQRKNWIDGVVVCGGEPTINADLPSFLKDLKRHNVAIKLDTNGSGFSMLQEILERELADYVAMDIKGPFMLYRRLTGSEIDERDDFLKGIATVQKFPDYEYRHTCVPLIEGDRIRWLSQQEIEVMAKYVVDVTQSNSHKFYIQKFSARDKDEMLDERFSKENLPPEFWETPPKVIEMAYEILKSYIPNTELR